MNKTSFLNKLESDAEFFYNNVPSKSKTKAFTNRLVNFLFPLDAFGKYDSKHYESEWEQLNEQFIELLSYSPYECKEVEEFKSSYFDELEDIYNKLNLDALAILEFDPAANNKEEVILAYPGFFAITIYRVAHPLYKKGFKLIARLMTEYAHEKTGIDIHPGAEIGDHFFIDHGTGVVIGESAIIGKNVKLYQGVTLGALSVSKNLQQTKRHPTIEDNVTIYSGATILGGNTIIGHDSTIGGNVWLTESVEPFSVVYHKSEIKIKNQKFYNEPLNFVI